MTKRFSKYVPDICNGYTVTITIVDNETGKQSESIDDFVDLLNEQHETIQRLKQNINELIQIDVEEDLLKENEQLKSFIKSLASPDGKIWLSSGYGYRIDKMLKGDVE